MARKNLGVFCSQEELSSIQLVMNHMSCIQQAINPANIPDNASDVQVTRFLVNLMKQKTEILFLEQNWWKEAKVNHNLPKDKDSWIDFETKEFYTQE